MSYNNHTIALSSTVEQSAVNGKVFGSNPEGRALNNTIHPETVPFLEPFSPYSNGVVYS